MRKEFPIFECLTKFAINGITFWEIKCKDTSCKSIMMNSAQSRQCILFLPHNFFNYIFSPKSQN